MARKKWLGGSPIRYDFPNFGIFAYGPTRLSLGSGFWVGWYMPRYEQREMGRHHLAQMIDFFARD
jgi:hypothetical protein